MKQIVRFAIIGLTLCAIAAGCKKGPSTVLVKNAPLNPPSGWRQHTVTKDGFVIYAPVNWVLESELKPFEGFQGEGIDPSQLEGMMNGQAPTMSEPEPPKGPTTTESGLKLVDSGTRPVPGEKRTNFVVEVQDVGSALLADQAAERKKGLGSSITSQKTLQLSFGPCEEFLTKTTGIGGDETFEAQYVICNESKVYVIKFLTTNNESALQGAQQIVDTFRLK